MNPGRDYIDRMWALKRSKNELDKKVLFALTTWSAQRDEFKTREVSKRSDHRELKSEVYSLIGFYSVFQGVMFQGVSQLTLSCKFRIIPICLSVFASFATIVGVSMKFLDMMTLQDSFQTDKEYLQVLETKISKIQLSGREFDFDSPIGDSLNLRRAFEKQSSYAKIKNASILVYLILFSVGFAYIISVIMCKDY